MRLVKLLVFLTIIFFSFGLFIFEAYPAEENPCVTCHADLKQPAKSVHAAIALGCSSCHKAVEGKSHPDQKGSIILTQNMPGLCYSCHDESKFKGKSFHQPVAGGMCTSCHNAHQSNFPKILLKDIPGLCYTCHAESKFKSGKSGHTLVGMCTGCHNPHSSNANNLLKSEQPDICYTCHEKSQFSKKYVHSIIPAGGCTSCHIPHTSQYPNLLSNNIHELCITCHTNKADGRHIVSIPGKRIHPVKGIIDPSTTTMIQEIDPANRTKSRLVPDPRNPGKPITCVSCHNPHSSDFAKLFPTGQICKKCHKEY